MRTRTRRVAPPALRLLHLVSWPSYGDESQTPSARLPTHSLSHLDMLHGCERFAPHCSPPGPFDWRPESGLLPDKDFREVPSARVWDMRAFWRERHGSHPAATRARRNATRPSISCTRVGVRARGGGRTRGVRPRRGLRREEGTAGSGCGAGADCGKGSPACVGPCPCVGQCVGRCVARRGTLCNTRAMACNAMPPHVRMRGVRRAAGERRAMACGGRAHGHSLGATATWPCAPRPSG